MADSNRSPEKRVYVGPGMYWEEIVNKDHPTPDSVPEKCHRNGEWALCWRVRCNLGKHCALCELCHGTKKAMARVQYRDGRACSMEERPCPL